MSFPLYFLLALFAVSLGSTAPAQTITNQPPLATISQSGQAATLDALYESLVSRETDRVRLLEELQAATDEVSKSELRTKLAQNHNDIEEIKTKFHRIALGVDDSIFKQDATQSFDLQKELIQLAQPVISELKAATADSRALEELRQEKLVHEERRDLAHEAVANLSDILKLDLDPGLHDRLVGSRTLWERRETDAHNQLTAIEHQIIQNTPKKEALLSRTRDGAMNFFRSRGLNLFLGLAAFGGVMLLMRGFAWLFRKFRPERRHRRFGDRLGSLVWQFLTVIGAISAMMYVFNMTADWFLLSLTVIFLLGMGWAGFQTIPQYLALIRIMLNLGAVKENERIVFDDIPWKVTGIGFVTKLVNPDLDGGCMQLPTRMIVGHHSRPAGKDEEWFPCRQGDWILLSEGTFGRVAYQTPSMVQIVRPGGTQKLFPTTDFLSLHPQVLSTGFRIEIDFALDYCHRDIAGGEVLEKMRNASEDHLSDFLGERLQKVQVEIGATASSSIDFRILADCSGEAASRWEHIPRELRQALIQLCNHEGWTMPFHQVTLHRGKA